MGVVVESVEEGGHSGGVAEYCRHHERIWPEIAGSIRNAGIVAMEIWRTGNRLVIVMETRKLPRQAHSLE